MVAIDREMYTPEAVHFHTIDGLAQLIRVRIVECQSQIMVTTS